MPLNFNFFHLVFHTWTGQFFVSTQFFFQNPEGSIVPKSLHKKQTQQYGARTFLCKKTKKNKNKIHAEPYS